MKKHERPKSAAEPDLPRGWTAKKIRELVDYYDNQTEEAQFAEHEAADQASDQTMIGVPTELVPEVRRLIARRRR
jgi:hypothetical protein